MEILEKILPVITLIAGWFLSETSQFFKTRKEDKKGLAKAISELLDIRHQIVAEHIILPKLAEHLEIPEEMRKDFCKQVSISFKEDLLNIEEISRRYNDAVTLISSVNPVLGFKMRSKNLLQNLVEKFDIFEEKEQFPPNLNKESKKQISKLKKDMLEKGINSLEEILLDISWQYSFFTWWDVKKIINRKDLVAEETIDFIKEIQTND